MPSQTAGMKFRFIISFLLSAVLFLPGLSQQVSFIKYTVQDGLVANPVRCVFQDSKGFIWVGTFDGLSRYDGYKFTNYTSVNGLSHNFINSIIEVDGKILVAENNGSIDIIENNSIRNTLKVGSAANVIRRTNDRILVTTDAHGFFKYENDSLILLHQPEVISSLGHFLYLRDDLLLCDGVDDDLSLFVTRQSGTRR